LLNLLIYGIVEFGERFTYRPRRQSCGVRRVATSRFRLGVVGLQGGREILL